MINPLKERFQLSLICSHCLQIYLFVLTKTYFFQSQSVFDDDFAKFGPKINSSSFLEPVEENFVYSTEDLLITHFLQSYLSNSISQISWDCPSGINSKYSCIKLFLFVTTLLIGFEELFIWVIFTEYVWILEMQWIELTDAGTTGVSVGNFFETILICVELDSWIPNQGGWFFELHNQTQHILESIQFDHIFWEQINIITFYGTELFLNARYKFSISFGKQALKRWIQNPLSFLAPTWNWIISEHIQNSLFY